MISEPELVGGVDFPTGQVLVVEPPRTKAPGPRRPWLWALGGAVVTSAVWAGGLYAYERTQGDGVDLAGYRTVDQLCEKAQLKALSEVLGTQSTDAGSPTEKHPALDRARCSVTLGSPETGYSAEISYDLHKVTDPGPEFEARLGDMAADAEPVEGIGERAFFHRDDDDSGAWMRVLDGQAELEIWISSQQTWDVETDEAVPSTKTVDLSGIDTVLAQDLRTLMAALKR
ncbi:hypothetical protein ACFV9D_15050 [Streptomyces sp. NPDC059875]|uniref:hypothetical protein n=1 Tax=unclassified Streptomyces TaxID=2593676 RepID=UPI0036545BD3